MKLTVLGSSGAWPERGRACSGYLLESGGVRLVLDLGFGTLPRLLEQCPASAVQAVFISHAHADHCVDLFGLFRARTLPDPPFPALPVYAMPDVLERVGGLDGERGPARLRRELEFHPTGPGQSFDVGPFRVRTFVLPHFIPNLGVRVEAEGKVVAYTGDTGPTDRIVDLAQGVDLFVCEATHQGVPPAAGERFLLSASEAGRYARAASARRLLLTHFLPGDSREVSRTEARQEFDGKLLVAEEALTLSLE
ncbi:MAG: MBL fold metallo-hydrolase [Thermoplasmata archaeon]